MDEAEFNGDLITVSPWLQQVLSDSEGLSSWGIDPAVAAVIICSTLIILRLLSIAKVALDVVIENWAEELEMEREEKRHLQRKRLKQNSELDPGDVLFDLDGPPS